MEVIYIVFILVELYNVVLVDIFIGKVNLMYLDVSSEILMFFFKIFLIWKVVD